MRDTSNLPLPPATDPPPSGYETVFGQDAGWRDPAGPARAAAAAAREAAAAAAPAAPRPPAVATHFDYPENGVLYQPEKPVSVETTTTAPAATTTTEAAPVAAPFRIKTPSGFEIEADPQEVAKRYAEYERLKQGASEAEALRNWAQANPDRASILERVVRGEDLSEIAASQGAADPDASDQARSHDPRYLALEARTKALEAELARATHGQAEKQIQQSLAQVLDAVPFTKTAPPEIRDAVAELAKLDHARYQHEGVTLADAVRKRAALMEQGYRERLNAAASRPAAPAPLGPDRQPPSSVTTRRPTQTGLGLQEYLSRFQSQ